MSTLKRIGHDRVKGPIVTVVMDGVGLSDFTEGNALFHARTPNLDHLFKQYGCVPLSAHGKSVGLPSDGDMGNSEVGHNALGAGRIFEQGASLVRNAIQSKDLFRGETWKWLVEGALESGQPLHLIGLLSDGNVHSHEEHLHALIQQAACEGLQEVRVHILLDGRDVSEISALRYIDRLESLLSELRSSGYHYMIASGGGRMTTTMDRYEADWSMVERGWKVHVLGEGRSFSSAREAIETFRVEQPGITDQQLPSFVIANEQGPVGQIHDGASVCFFNFRGDRAVEISRAFEEKSFSGFNRQYVNVRFAGMMQYDGDLKLPQRFLVNPPKIDRPLGELIAGTGLTQLACSETQKFGHVTYFWNGNRSGCFNEQNERYIEIPSDLIPFEQRPWMKAAEITDQTLNAMKERHFDHVRINYANGDMVGHTGNFEATILSIEALDLSLGRLLNGIKKLNGIALITADHGNAEQMYERDKKSGMIVKSASGKIKPLTSHTLNQVPLCLYDPHRQAPQLSTGLDQPGLANLAATTIELLGFEAPSDYEPSLLRWD